LTTGTVVSPFDCAGRGKPLLLVYACDLLSHTKHTGTTANCEYHPFHPDSRIPILSFEPYRLSPCCV
jgi:hypothetical protein